MFVNFDEDEETTCIKKLTYLRFSYWKAIILVPILSVCTGMIFALCLFWKQSLRLKFFYTTSYSLETATNVLVEGVLKDVLDIVDLYAPDLKNKKKKDAFCFRFIKFRFDEHANMFRPILLDVTDTHKGIIKQFARGLPQERIKELQYMYGPC